MGYAINRIPEGLLIWDMVRDYILDTEGKDNVLKLPKMNRPKLVCMGDNPGIADYAVRWDNTSHTPLLLDDVINVSSKSRGVCFTIFNSLHNINYITSEQSLNVKNL